ncbi:TB2/DP1, HVA22 family-domain-containing protein [Biscogniauxia mediterranea]|nr:TB2/DP1, HVA22 family-domain-containing protein [Biscogniauxia mediterranea]
MFGLVARLISSIASFLFPLFASYKALKTSDPAQLTPWLMYWSVFSCVVLVESWTQFILVWVPFYSWMRMFFLLWLVLPSTQGARQLYEAYLHPYLAENEAAIEEFIASAHDRLKAKGITYLQQAIELVRTRFLGLPPREIQQQPSTRAASAPQGYTQALLARFSVPASRWAANNAGTAGHDFYSLLAGAVSAATSMGGGSSGGGAEMSSSSSTARGASGVLSGSSGSLIPENISGAQDKVAFIAAQKERLAFMMGALEKEAQQLERNEERRVAEQQARKDLRNASMNLDGQDATSPSRPPSGHSVWSGLSKSRSEVDFEKIDAESGAEDDENGSLRRRAPGAGGPEDPNAPRGGWSFLGWGQTAGGAPMGGSGQSTGFQQQ